MTAQSKPIRQVLGSAQIVSMHSDEVCTADVCATLSMHHIREHIMEMKAIFAEAPDEVMKHFYDIGAAVLELGE